MRYKFSVIIPMLNLEDYLEESVGSLLCQSIGFQENIQLILINDGSTDRTEEICQSYRQQYPDNIVYVSQENKGVSAARNAGIPYVRGKYVNFFDGDDIWQRDGFERVWDFFDEHGSRVDVVTCAQKQFEAKDAYRETYYKFRDGDRLIDVQEEPAAVELSVGSAFFKAELLEELRFDERLDYGENALFMTLAILKKGGYGVLQSVEYFVRRRQDHTSATQNRKPTWQTTTLKYCHNHLLELSNTTHKQYRTYIQHVIMKTLKYRVIQEVLVQESAEEYRKEIRDLLLAVDPVVIASAPYMTYPLKVYILDLKNDGELRDKLGIKRDRLYYENLRLTNLARKSLVIEKVQADRTGCHVSGWLRYALPWEFRLTAQAGDKEIPVRVTDSEKHSTDSVFGHRICQGREFEVVFPTVRKAAGVSFFLTVGEQTIKLEPSFNGAAKGLTMDLLEEVITQPDLLINMIIQKN